MSTIRQKRIDILESTARRGSRAEFDTTDVVFMHVPEDGQNDPHAVAAE